MALAETVYVFGNEYLEEDKLAREVADILPCTVKHCRSPEELLDAPEKLIVLDVVKGLREVKLIKREDLKGRKLVSMHDMDLAFFLELMQVTGIQKEVRIIGIPQKGNTQKIAEEVTQCLKKLE